MDDYEEISDDRYETLRDAYSQMNAEGWIEVFRRSNEPVEIRPVDRQEDRQEGMLIESDEWVVREQNGDTYVIDDETLEDEFYDHAFETKRFVIDLSYDGEELDGVEDDVPDGVDIETEGRDVKIDVIAVIDVRRQTVFSLDIENVRMDRSFYEGGLPIEVLGDHPDVSELDDGVIDDE